MSDTHLHIIAFNVPFPVDQGGIFDVFYKIKALHALGIKIHLHCFDYGKGEDATLDKYCYAVHYYKRLRGFNAFSLSLPYIVSSRYNKQLFDELLKDNYPILMEGVHTSYLLLDKRFINRICLLRLHNTEFRYYKELASHAKSFFRKCYFHWESYLLKAYEKRIANKAVLLSITATDEGVYKTLFGAKRTHTIPLFLADNWAPKEKDPNGAYCLYHGDLSIDSNEQMAIWLLTKVFSKLSIPFVIAGRNPSPKLEKQAHVLGHTCLVANPTEHEMQDMIAKAHINIVPSLTTTGIKIKLVNALINGRHCISNTAGIGGSELDSICTKADTAEEFIQLITQLFSLPFSSDEMNRRMTLIQTTFNNEKGARFIQELMVGSK